MSEFLASLRELNFLSLVLRLVLAMLLGGMIGMERGRKRRAAGFRTYLLVSMGAALTMLLGQYLFNMQSGSWAALSESLAVKTDVSRLGAQVINGIGFLGAGTIIVTGRQEVKGLTTAAGLWASACMGLAVGAGFYECVLLAFILILLSIRVLPHIENYVIENSRNINIYVEFESMDDIGGVINQIKKLNANILDVEIDRGGGEKAHPSACFILRLQKKMRHVDFLADIAENRRICAIEEL
ncbi:MAG: MgtC/SapB family protein [Ruminococcaceae bacterium]|nr:MgtC/SapB family protein [Oscillospiraceae bacterium]